VASLVELYGGTRSLCLAITATPPPSSPLSFVYTASNAYIESYNAPHAVKRATTSDRPFAGL